MRSATDEARAPGAGSLDGGEVGRYEAGCFEVRPPPRSRSSLRSAARRPHGRRRLPARPSATTQLRRARVVRVTGRGSRCRRTSMRASSSHSKCWRTGRSGVRASSANRSKGAASGRRVYDSCVRATVGLQGTTRTDGRREPSSGSRATSRSVARRRRVQRSTPGARSCRRSLRRQNGVETVVGNLGARRDQRRCSRRDSFARSPERVRRPLADRIGRLSPRLEQEVLDEPRRPRPARREPALESVGDQRKLRSAVVEDSDDIDFVAACRGRRPSEGSPGSDLKGHARTRRTGIDSRDGRLARRRRRASRHRRTSSTLWPRTTVPSPPASAQLHAA